MRRIAMWVGMSLVAAAVLTGCPPAYPNCDSDQQCKEKGEVCVQGKCQECAADANCKEGFTCQGNKCVPKPPECTSDAACTGGRICEANKCVDPQCGADKPCPRGGECMAGRCQAPRAECSGSADCGEGRECQAGKCVAAAPSCNWAPLRFGFNEANLTSEAQDQLKDLVRCLREGSGALELAGHADERGTEEYNLQLSQKRANAVKRYLQDLGVTAGQLKTVGYGENKPADPSSSEEAWSTNRRVEFVR
jgi:peptidoglycan-associated lipoprotein